MRPIPFRYTFSVTKAEERADGLFLIGEASGPEVDATNERMHPDAIARFAAQIIAMADAGTPLTYRDAHAVDGVMRDLGEVVSARIDDRFHLNIEVKLDEDSPAAVYLFKQIKTRGKKFGMSIAGTVLDFVDEFATEVGRVVRTYLDIVLTEISNTTRPAWTPSFGTVLSKAIDEADAEFIATQGENVDLEKDALAAGESTEAPAEDVEKDEPQEAAEDVTEKSDEETVDETVDETGEATEKADETPAAEADEPVEKADDTDTETSEDEAAEAETAKSEDETPAADEAPETESTEKADEDETVEDVEKAGRSISAANAKRLNALFAHFTSEMKAMGLIEEDAPAKSDSPDAETDLTKALDEATVAKTALEKRVEELQQSLTEKTARITELENTPAAPAPALVTTKDETEEAFKAIAAMSPMDRLKLGLSLAHSA